MQITGLARTENKDVIQVENEKLGVTHIDVGVALLEKWGIPGLITECVRKHHDIEHIGPYAIETSIVFLANQLSRLEVMESLGMVDLDIDEDLEDIYLFNTHLERL